MKQNRIGAGRLEGLSGEKVKAIQQQQKSNVMLLSQNRR